jgi:hypothetical protein
MRTKSLVAAITATAALLSTAALSAASPPAPSSLLLRYRVTFDAIIGPTATTDSFIFRDGLVIQKGTDGLGACAVVRADAVPEKLRQLRDALARNRVATQEGDCSSEPPDEGLVEREVTWFGKGTRTHTYRTGAGLGEMCPLSTLEIDLAITALLGTVVDAQTAQTCP